MRTPVVLVLMLVLVAGLAVAGGVAARPAAAVTPLAATLQATFTGQTTQTLYDQLGTAVAVSGDTALVGAQYFQDTTKDPDPYHTGEVYVYVRSDGAWTQQAVLKAPDETDDSYFGCSVAIDGDTAAVGAYGHLGTAGSVYVFTRSGGSWSLQQQVNGPTHSETGWSVAISGDTLLAGAPAYYATDTSPVTGAARVYTRTGGVWTLQQQLTAADGAGSDRFGWSVALDGDSAVVGAPFKNGGIPNGAGAAYVFARSGRRLVPAAEGGRSRGRQPRPIGGHLDAHRPGGRAGLVQRRGLGHGARRHRRHVGQADRVRLRRLGPRRPPRLQRRVLRRPGDRRRPGADDRRGELRRSRLRVRALGRRLDPASPDRPAHPLHHDALRPGRGVGRCYRARRRAAAVQPLHRRTRTPTCSRRPPTPPRR